MNNIIIRKLEKTDYNKNYLQLLEQLTVVSDKIISYDDFCKKFDNINSEIYVIEYDNKIIATASILFEEKFIHNLGKVAHIEDVVIDIKYRRNGLGKKLMNFLIELAKNNKCYKIILNCYEQYTKFYKSVGFDWKCLTMTYYF